MSVDLGNGHLDISAGDVHLPGRGPDLSFVHTWDSALAQAGITTAAGQGWLSSVTPSMGGVLTGTVVLSDATGATWPFTYTGDPMATDPYTAYTTPPGLPWQLATSLTGGYTLTNILSGETLAFDPQGRYLAHADTYGNANTLAYGPSGPTSVTNSGGRALTLAYQNGLLGDVQSPLWQSSGGTQGQHVTYGYNGSGQLTTLTRGAGTGDAAADTFGYSGTQLVTVTTPAGHTWTLSYDALGRVSGITSPVSGTNPQAPGYTPAYTTAFFYQPQQTQVVQGYGSSGALTTTYTLDGQGEPTAVQDTLGDTTQYTYDQDHAVTSRSDATHHTTYNSYQYVGPSGSTALLTQTVAPAIQPYTWLNSYTTPVTTTHYYNSHNDLIETDRPEGGVIQYAYDDHHAVITTTETTRYQVGMSCGQGPVSALPARRSAFSAALGGGTPCSYTYFWRASVNQYDPHGERIATTDGRGVTVQPTSTQLLSASLLTTTATFNDPQGLYTQHFTYTAQGDLAGAGTPVITTTLNGITTTAPVTTAYGYDGDGNQTSVTAANGATTTTGYDHLGRAVQVNTPAVPLWSNPATPVTPTELTRYDGDGNVVSTQDGTGGVSTSSYDPLGRPVVQTNAVSGTTLITYSATQQVAVQDPQGNVSTSQYDPAGRLLQVTDPVSGTTQYQDDPVGNTVAITSGTTGGAVSSVQTRQYDAQNRVISATVSGPGGPGSPSLSLTTRTAYDQDGNVAQVGQPNGDVTYNTYDLADRLTQVELDSAAVVGGPGTTSPQFEGYSYDDADNLATSSDFNNDFHHALLVDGANRVLQSSDSTPSGNGTTGTTLITTTTGFDPDGNTLRRATQTQPPTGPVQTSVSTSTVNAADWLSTQSDNGLVTRYGYDGAGQPRTQTVLTSTVPVTTVLDMEGRATAIGEKAVGTTAYTSTVGYNADDRPLTVTVPGSVQETLKYDAASRLSHVGASGPTKQTTSATLSSSYDYGDDPASGWTTALTSTINAINNGQPVTQTLTHDAAGRLTTLQSAGGMQRWSYDANGNLTSSVSGTVTTAYSYTAAITPNAVLTVTTTGQPSAYYGYDPNGDTTRITTTGTISTGLSYDAQGRLSAVTLKDGTTVAQSYNAAGQRASYTVSKGGTTSLRQTFGYRGTELAQAIVVSGTTAYTDTYLYTQQSQPLELIRQTKSGSTLSTARYWYEVDGRGNVVALTDTSGKVPDRYSYDAWGALTSVSESVPQRLRYAGYWYDQEVGWYWVSVRDYDPVLKRWLQPDPSQRDGVRTYVYADDNPIDEADPTGLASGFPSVCSLPNRPSSCFHRPSQADNNPCDVPIFGHWCDRNMAKRAKEFDRYMAHLAMATGGGLVRVGRWMSRDEYDKMETSGYVQESRSGATNVTYPPNPRSFLPQKADDVFATFKVPFSRLARTAGHGGQGWYRITTARTIDGRLATYKGEPLPPAEMPQAVEPQIEAENTSSGIVYLNLGPPEGPPHEV